VTTREVIGLRERVTVTFAPYRLTQVGGGANVIRPYPILRSDSAFGRLPLHLDSSRTDFPLSPNNWAGVKERILRLARILFPSLIALTLTTAAHAQGTMDFSGAQTLMGTFKTFAVYAGAATQYWVSVHGLGPSPMFPNRTRFANI
jgi:hypothetical protein